MRYGRWMVAVTGALVLLALPGRGRAEPWTALSPVSAASLDRRVSGGWLLTPLAGELDPALGQPATESTLWGLATPERVALVLGSGRVRRWSLGAAVAWAGVATATDRLVAEPDASADELAWHWSRAPVAATALVVAGRLGMRGAAWGWGLAAGWRRRAQAIVPSWTFPTTALVPLAGARSDERYDATGTLLEEATERGDGLRSVETVRVGVDGGHRWRRSGLALAVAWERWRSRASDRYARAEVVARRRSAIALRELAFERELVNLRVRWSYGEAEPGWRSSLGAWYDLGLRLGRQGSESWTERTEQAYDVAVAEWIRELETLEPNFAAYGAEGGIGYAAVGRLRWGAGLEAGVAAARSEETWRERLRYREDVPEVPSLQPAVYVDAVGTARWRDRAEAWRWRLGLAVGGGYAVTPGWTLLAGADYTLRGEWERRERTLVDAEVITGERRTGDGTVDPVGIPYAVTETTVGAWRSTVVGALRLHLGVAFRDAQVGFGLLWSPTGDGRVAVEARWRW